MPKKCIIKDVHARMVYDSRGVPTIEVEVFTDDSMGRNAAPFGAPGSRGIYEASAYGSLGLKGAVEAVAKEIAPRLRGMDAADTDLCEAILRQIDTSENFSRIGGNTSSAVSIAIAKAAARSQRLPLYEFLSENAPTLPYPLGNMIGGGAHSMGPAPDMQEHLVVPVGASHLATAIRANILVHEETGRILEKADPHFAGGTDDECAWTADLNDYQALEMLSEACAAVTKKTGITFRKGLDVAADRLWDPARRAYVYDREKILRTTEEQINYMEDLVRTFDLYYVEDPFQSDDFVAFAELKKRVGTRCFVCGDDLLATNKRRTEEGVRSGAVNSMIIKVNQVGTITGARETNRVAQSQGLDTIISHRSGETEDHTIAHLGVAWNCLGIKTGVIGGERLAKLNELLRIEEHLGSRAKMVTPKIPVG
jgi:enolase